MAMGGSSSKGPNNNINVTPLVDVVLVLLIIFMVVTPMLQRGKDVKLPRAAKAEAEKKNTDAVVIAVTKDLRVFIEAEGLTDEKFENRMREKLAGAPGRKVLLKGDT